MSTTDSRKGLMARLRLDSHHAIERFGVLFGAFAVSAVLIFGGATTSSVANQQANMNATTLYTPSFNTSKTDLAGKVDGVYINATRTRSMVLMHFADASTVSANASKYQAFLTGSGVDLSPQALKTKVKGEIVVFGATGYMAMVLDSDQPFPEQILNLTLRANSQLVYKPTDTTRLREDLKGQKSFSEYDQWRLYFNPGASGATHTSALDGAQFDAGAVYAALVVAPQEKKQRSSLDDQLAQLQVDQTRIAEYQSEAARVNVDGVSLVLPTVPQQIAGDVVTGKPAAAGSPSTLQLKPKWVSPSGFDFDWRSSSISQGYLDSIVPSGQSYVTYLATKAALSKDGAAGQFQSSSLQWKLSNGGLLSDYGNTNSLMQPLIDIQNKLAQAYQDYYTHKLAYQVDSLTKLLDLEVDERTVQQGATVNDTKKALFIY